MRDRIPEQGDIAATPRRPPRGATLPAGMAALQRSAGNRAVSALVQRTVEAGKFNIVGEDHEESGKRRQLEQYLAGSLDLPYWQESTFRDHGGRYGDDPRLRTLHTLAELGTWLAVAEPFLDAAVNGLTAPQPDLAAVKGDLAELRSTLLLILETGLQLRLESRAIRPPGPLTDRVGALAAFVHDRVAGQLRQLQEDADLTDPSTVRAILTRLKKSMAAWMKFLVAVLREEGYDDSSIGSTGDFGPTIATLTTDRSDHMFAAAKAAASGGLTGVWKVGEQHVEDMADQHGSEVVLTPRDEFNGQYEAWLRT